MSFCFKKKILVFCPGLIPSVIIGVLRPLWALKRQKKIQLKIRLSGWDIFLKQEMNWCDIAVFCRNTEYRDLKYLYDLKKLGKKVIYEIDDNFFEIPLDTPVGYYHRDYLRLFVLKRFLELSDEVRVYSKIIQEIALKYNKNVSLINSYFDARLISNIQYHRATDKIKIVYPTGRIDASSLNLFLFNVIYQINQLYLHRIEFHFWGKIKPKFLENFNNIVMHQPIQNYDQFIRYFQAQQFDIGLAPLMEGRFFASKTNNKYREFAGCQVVGIYSNMPPYSDCVRTGYNGILVENNEQQWVNALSKLIDDHELRKNIIDRAKKDVIMNYSFDAAVKQMSISMQQSIMSNVSCDFLNYRRKINVLFIGHSHEIFYHIQKLTETLKGVNPYLLINLLYVPFDANQMNITKLQTTDLTIFQLEQYDEFEQMLGYINLCKHAVLDLSKFDGLLNVKFDFFSKNIIQIILNKAHQNDILPLDLQKIIKYKDNHLSLMTEDFSLEGYKAFYLEIIEKIDGLKNSNYYILSGMIDKWISRIKRLLLFLSYRYRWFNNL